MTGLFYNLIGAWKFLKNSSQVHQTFFLILEVGTRLHCTKLNSKWLSSLRLWVCTIDAVMLVENQEIVDLRATKWSGFMCKPC